MPEIADDLIDTLLAAAIRGAAPALPPKSAWPMLIAAAQREGVLPLLADAAESAHWAPEFIAAIRPFIMAEAALAIVGERELRAALDALAQDGVLPLLIKGAHLAFDVYPSPDRRPRLDVDLLIQVSDRERVARCVERLGYVPAARVTGDVAFGQCQYWRTDRTGATHTIDVHWRVANPKAFADRLTYDELRSHAVTLPRLGAHAFAPSASFALLIACIHRTAHHGTTTRLVWLYDIHLLAARLSEREWTALVEIAEARGLAPVVAAGLEDAREKLDTPVPEDLLERLHSHVNATDADVLAFLDGPLPQMQIAVSDWKRIRGWRARARFLREHLFPPPMYVQERYKSTSHVMLPLFYAHRIAAGSVKWLRRGVAG
jgi:hypothetical protein